MNLSQATLCGRPLAFVLALSIAIPASAQIFDPATDDSNTNTRVSSPDDSGNTRRTSGDSVRSSDAAADQIQVDRNGLPSERDEITDGNETDERDSTDGSRRTRDSQSSRLGTPRIIRQAPPGEFEIFASQVADKRLRRFGANLLVPEARDFIVPPDTIVPPDYRMSAGDVLVIGLTGSVEADALKLTIDSEGNIFLPRVGRVHVGGLRYADLQSTLSAQVARQYRNFQLSVAVDSLQGITVYVTGFANVPGSYSVSSLSTLVNAVFASGGPSSAGSFRSIQLRRDGQLVSDFDLYDLLLKGDKSADVVLQNGDVIFIAPVGAQVAVIGSANNEAIFEARPGDTLTDVVRYAGGVNTTAELARLLALDPLDLEAGWQEVSAAQASTQVAKRAQIVRVISNLGIARPLYKQSAFVTISGEVAKPGRYFLAPGTTIEEAIAQAGGLTPDAYTFGTVFTRETLRAAERKSYERATDDIEFLLTAAPLTSALSTSTDLTRVAELRSIVEQLRDREPDGRMILDIEHEDAVIPASIVLENNDSIYIPPMARTVGVFGAVPGAGSFQYRQGLTIGDFISEAGGVQKIGDRGQTFVVRANGKLLAPKRGLFGGNVLDEPALPGDLVFVPINPSRGEFWAKLSILTSTLFTGALTTAAVVSASR